MSIAAMILNSENEFEEKFYIPVASEAFSKNVGYLLLKN